jgi:hypothetical protein
MLTEQEQPDIYEMDPARAQRMAERHNAKLADELPLFAMTDQLDQVAGHQLWTADKLLHNWTVHNEAMRQFRGSLRERAAASRAAVAARVTSERLAELDDHQRMFPETPEYAADYWRRMLQELYV